MVYCKVHLKTEDGLLKTIKHEFRYTGTKLVLLLATICPYLGALMGIEGDGSGVHMTKHQPDPLANDMSYWPAIVQLLTTRFLYWGRDGGGGVKGPTGGVGVSGGIVRFHMKNEDGLLQSTLENWRYAIADNRKWAQVNGTQVNTTLGHQMPLPGGIDGHRGWSGEVHMTIHQPEPQADDMSCWLAVLQLLTIRCLYLGGGGSVKGLTRGIVVLGAWGVSYEK